MTGVKLLRKLRRAFFGSDPSFCDMHDDAHARQAADEYLGRIRGHLQERFGGRKLAILDAGCQAGRLLVPLAREGHQLIGIDTSGIALRRARDHAREFSVGAELPRGGTVQLRRWVAPDCVDVALCIEVLYLCHDYRKLFRLLVDSVKPGGLICISHRPAGYYVAGAVARGEREMAARIAAESEGPTAEGGYYNWQTPGQLDELYRSAGLTIRGIYPVDHATRPIDWTNAQDPKVAALLEPYRSNGAVRMPMYLLVVAEKPL